MKVKVKGSRGGGVGTCSPDILTVCLADKGSIYGKESFGMWCLAGRGTEIEKVQIS